MDHMTWCSVCSGLTCLPFIQLVYVFLFDLAVSIKNVCKSHMIQYKSVQLLVIYNINARMHAHFISTVCCAIYSP